MQPPCHVYKKAFHDTPPHPPALRLSASSSLMSAILGKGEIVVLFRAEHSQSLNFQHFDHVSTLRWRKKTKLKLSCKLPSF